MQFSQICGTFILMTNDYYPRKRFPAHKLEYQKYRVKSAVRSFRDLEVYKTTTQLAVAIFKINPKNQNKLLKEELEILRNLAKNIPRMIVEAYGDKFNNIILSLAKLEKAMQFINNVIAKIDFLVASLDDQSVKEELIGLLRKYQTQRVKILNLKRAWERVFTK